MPQPPRDRAGQVACSGDGRREITMSAAGLAGTQPAAAAMQYYAKIGTQPGWPMRDRYAFGWVGGRYIGLHRAPQSFPFDPTFHSMCDAWSNYFNAMWLRYVSSTVRLSWVGTAGVGGYQPGSNHNTGNAFDLTATYFSNGGYIDTYYSHQAGAGATHNRRWSSTRAR